MTHGLLALVYELLFAETAAGPADDVVRRKYELAPALRRNSIPLPLDQQIAQWQRRSEEYAVGIAAVLMVAIGGGTVLILRIVTTPVRAPVLVPWLLGYLPTLVVWRRRRHIRQVAERWTARDVAAQTPTSRPPA